MSPPIRGRGVTQGRFPAAFGRGSFGIFHFNDGPFSGPPIEGLSLFVCSVLTINQESVGPMDCEARRSLVPENTQYTSFVPHLAHKDDHDRTAEG